MRRIVLLSTTSRSETLGRAQRQASVDRAPDRALVQGVWAFGVCTAKPQPGWRCAPCQREVPKSGGSLRPTKHAAAMYLMIAVHARTLGPILVRNNVEDFRRVKGLKHENWMEWTARHPSSTLEVSECLSPARSHP